MTMLDRPLPDRTARFRGRAALNRWVRATAEITQPERIVWCDGTDEERQRITDLAVAAGTLIPLNPSLRPDSFLARSDPDDVARLEGRTFICSTDESDAGPTNNWRAPTAMRLELQDLLTGAMRGRTMYVIPYSMGPIGGSLSRVGVEITDSPYVVLSTRIMTRMGDAALTAIDAGAEWVPGVHSVGMPLRDDTGHSIPDVAWPTNVVKVIAHFPETREIVSFGSGYGGNALLAKKCVALRIGSVIAREEGWLAEHMLLMRLTTPAGRTFHLAAAFPSACGKTNFAMLSPSLPGWRVETIGDDIAWLRIDQDGTLRAVNPEAGFFGVAPGTGESTNPAAVATMRANTIFTNVALTPDRDVWWEGKTSEPPEHLVDWLGEDWTPGAGRAAAHPNGRFTAPIEQCPTLAMNWDAPDGVPVDAIVFGGRRASTVPLVAEASDWADGVFFGATVASEQTAAAEGRIGALRFDPFAMLPFCGYDMADHWAHWLHMGTRLGGRAPRIFRVNWFRRGADGRYLWPGFGENIRVLAWIARRLEHDAGGVPTPIGLLPYRHDLDLDGLDLPDPDVRALITLDVSAWQWECEAIAELFARFGDRMPSGLTARLRRLQHRLAGYA